MRKKLISKIVKVGERGQITIPKDIRLLESIEPKDFMKITDVAGTIILSKIEQRSADERFFELVQESGLSEKDWKEIQKERDEER